MGDPPDDPTRGRCREARDKVKCNAATLADSPRNPRKAPAVLFMAADAL